MHTFILKALRAFKLVLLNLNSHAQFVQAKTQISFVILAW